MNADPYTLNLGGQHGRDGMAFYVAADRTQIVEQLRVAFPGRILSWQDVFRLPPGFARDRMDLLELLLLGRLQDMIVTEASTFTEASWILGGARARAHVVSPSAEGL